MLRGLAVAAAIAAAGSATADTVDLSYLGGGKGLSVSVAGPGRSGAVFAGQLVHAFSNGSGVASGWTGSHITFCTELAEVVSTSSVEYTVEDVADVPAPGPGMGADRAQALRDLYAAANGAQFGTDNLQAAAFQVALWELAFDFDLGETTADLNGGAFKVTSTSTGVRMQAEAWLNTALANYGLASTGLVGLSRSGKQDQIFLVPLPAPVALGLAGLVAVAGMRRLRPR